MSILDRRPGFVGGHEVPQRVLAPLSRERLTDWVRLSILVVVAGYRFEGRLRVRWLSPFCPPDFARLGNFLTFLINYPSSLPLIRVSVEQCHDRSCRKAVAEVVDGSSLRRTVVLASGGLDSTAALIWALERSGDVEAVWVDYGQAYAVAERKAVEEVCRTLGVALTALRADLGREITKGSAVYGHIVPARNLLLVTLAAASPGVRSIILAGLRDETKIPDKSKRFYRQISKWIGLPVTTPFAEATKTDVVAWWRLRATRLDPRVTVSCYRADGRCGRCRACTKRAIAFAAANFDDGDHWEVDPLTDPEGIIRNDYLPRWKRFSRERQADMLLAFQNARGRLPAAVLSFSERCYADAGVREWVEERARNLGAW